MAEHGAAGETLVGFADEAFCARIAEATARFVLRCPAQTAAAITPALGVAPPDAINRATGAPALGALRLGPDEWLLLREGADAAALGAHLDAALRDAPHSLVDVSHRQTGLTLDGRLAPRVLSAGCPLDLRETAFPVGMATRTIFLKAEIILWRLDATRFHVEAQRSFAPYVLGHLAAARRGADGL